MLSLGDAHLYQNHLEQAKRQLARQPGRLPRLRLDPRVGSVFDFAYEDLELIDYKPQKGILAPIAV